MLRSLVGSEMCIRDSCTSLKAIDFTPLTKVVKLGNRVLKDCTGLTSINLRGLENVTTVPDDFLSGCSSLTTVDLTPCLLYTSDAADEEDSVDLGGRRIIKKKKSETNVDKN
eukprot:TRINITY_DN65793_c0_g1_i2.p2 TRINITY_DN65793_c0_g1~~TRINITY_DN65793_c0_g1_i2.p2  ORF type:complete len:112 (-),score=30.40 TRINITY_DN65793_c0_g1_i2:52-387(-)